MASKPGHNAPSVVCLIKAKLRETVTSINMNALFVGCSSVNTFFFFPLYFWLSYYTSDNSILALEKGKHSYSLVLGSVWTSGGWKFQSSIFFPPRDLNCTGGIFQMIKKRSCQIGLLIKNQHDYCKHRLGAPACWVLTGQIWSRKHQFNFNKMRLSGSISLYLTLGSTLQNEA